MFWFTVALITLLVLAIAFLFFLYFVADYFTKNFFMRAKTSSDVDRDLGDLIEKVDASASTRIREGIANLRTLPLEDVFINSFDGLRLHAKYYQNGNSKRTIILVHGYKSYGAHDFSCAIDLYRSHGLNFLLIDHRAHGESEGEYICFGIKERHDVVSWCKYLSERIPEGEIILSGISMGCTTALLAAALPDMPNNLVGIIADCGYTSPRDEFVHVMKSSMHIPIFPFLPFAERVVKHRAGFGFSDASTVDAVKALSIPVLFIHGEADNFVPLECSRRNFEACASDYKRLITVADAGHGMSFLGDEERCRKEIKAFFEII